MPNSVMPKGVEHAISSAVRERPKRVPNSVMPKGVEHFWALSILEGIVWCRIQ